MSLFSLLFLVDGVNTINRNLHKGRLLTFWYPSTGAVTVSSPPPVKWICQCA